MAQTDGQTEARFLIHLTVSGIDFGIWDTWAGGDKDTNSTKYRSGGNPDEDSLGGGATYTDLTLTRNYRIARDGVAEPALLNLVTIGDCIALKQPLDRSYKAVGVAIKALGGLKTLQSTPANSNGNNAAMIGVVIEPFSISGT